MSGPRARCAAAGCTNFARPRTAFCAAHKGLGGDVAAVTAPTLATPEESRRLRAAEAFRQRVDAGDYRGLFGGKLGALMAQAAEEQGVGDELGVLRYVMARLIAEEEDPVTLAKAIARVASVSIQAARAQRAINGQLAEGLTDAITSILVELDGQAGSGG